MNEMKTRKMRKLFNWLYLTITICMVVVASYEIIMQDYFFTFAMGWCVGSTLATALINGLKYL